MKLFYVHHGMRDKGNPPSQDDGLKPLGKKDALLTGKILKDVADRGYNLKAIYTSPYYRCKETARLINKTLRVPIVEEPRFNEFTGVYYLIKNKKENSPKESWVECQNRIQEAIKEIVNKYDEKDMVVCVTSGVNISAFINIAYGLKPSEKTPYPHVPSCSPIGFDITRS